MLFRARLKEVVGSLLARGALTLGVGLLVLPTAGTPLRVAMATVADPMLDRIDEDPARVNAVEPPQKPAPTAAELAATRAQATLRLKQVGLAMVTSLAMNQAQDGLHHFPNADSRDPQGRPLLSWRVHLLPSLGEEALYRRFHLDEPWDSPHNLRLVDRMPNVYRVGGAETVAKGKTCVLLPLGEKTIFPGGPGLALEQIRDGTSVTILAVEADDASAVIWTQPADWKFDPDHPTAGLDGHFGDGFLALFADGSVHAIRGDVDPSVVRALFTAVGGERVAVPGRVGNVPPNERRSRAAQPVNPDFALRVVDEQNRPVPTFEISIQTADHGYTSWHTGSKGRITLDQFFAFRESLVIDLVVKAEGYSSTVVRFSGPEREKLFGGRATIVLRQGEEVALSLRLPRGMTYPTGLLPEVYFGDYQERARMMWQPGNHKPASRDFDQVGLRAAGAGRSTFRLARESAPIYVAIHSPGFLQFFERGPFTLADVKNGVLEIDVETPAVLDVSFDPGPGDADHLPFTEATITLMHKEPGTERTYLTVATAEAPTQRQELRLADLSPGDYWVTVRTKARPGVTDVPGTRAPSINPGVYLDAREFTLGTGQTRRIDFRFAPIDLDAYRGRRTARVRITRPDGKPAVGRQVTVDYFDGHYGMLVVYSGKVPESGVLTLKDITDRRPDMQSPGPYAVQIDDQTLGNFGFATGAEVEEFAFGVTPVAGDLAPDIELLGAADGTRTKLSELRGKVVCLEFWATWCGPCREPMERLNQLAGEKKDAWNDRVILVPLSIDDQPDRAERFMSQRGWNHLKPFWAGSREGAATGWESPAARAYLVQGVPTTLIIGRDGRILWRGHPLDTTDGQDIETRIEAAIKP